MDKGNALEIRGLHAGYGHQEILRGLDLTARGGELTALLGRNGSGKSTLLRAAAGLLPAGGDVRLGGEDALGGGERMRAKRIAYIPQRPRLDPGETALEAVLMGANARTPLLGGYTRAQRAQAADCLARVGAAAFAQRLTGELSEGQRQLVVFARALMQRPRAMLLDEMDSALDLPRRYEILRLVRQTAEETGCAALCALHDPQLALCVCDRVLLLMDGRIAGEMDMAAADEETATRALSMLYGGVRAARMDGAWAVLPLEALQRPISLV